MLHTDTLTLLYFKRPTDFLVRSYDTRDASQHSLLKQFKKKNPRMRSKIGCFYFADIQNEESPSESDISSLDNDSIASDYEVSSKLVVGVL